MSHLKTSVENPLTHNIAVVARTARPKSGLSTAQRQTLAIGKSRLQEVISNGDGHGSVQLSADIDLRSVEGQPLSFASAAATPIVGAAWDAFTASIILISESCVMCLTYYNSIVLLAGVKNDSVDREKTDGPGSTARFGFISNVTASGTGCLYASDNLHVRVIRLPACLKGSGQSPPNTPGSAAGVDEAASHVLVTTLPFEAASYVMGLAYVAGTSEEEEEEEEEEPPGGSLVLATSTALYRVPLGPDGNIVAAGVQPQPVAGSEESSGEVDDAGPAARFTQILGITADRQGSVYAVCDSNSCLCIRKVDPDGWVTTLVSEIEHIPGFQQPCILPNGYLALPGSNKIVFVDLKLQPPPLLASASASTATSDPPLPRTLPEDLGALLDRQPDATSDITLLVGDHSFAAHRGILAARSDYFRQMLASGDFAEAHQQQLSLPEANPEAFEHVLRFIYTGRIELPGSLACSVADLADRLLLPDLCRTALARVLADVTAESVVDSMMWAESRGGGLFAHLLVELKAWYLEHHEEVMVAAQPSLKRLSVEMPDLMMELHGELGKRARRG